MNPGSLSVDPPTGTRLNALTFPDVQAVAIGEGLILLRLTGGEVAMVTGEPPPMLSREAQQRIAYTLLHWLGERAP